MVQSEPVPPEIFDEVPRPFNKPLKKQLKLSDVDGNQSRLMLPRQFVAKSIVPYLEASENPSVGINVLVYGPDRKVQHMIFKLWKRAPVLTSGWKEFVTKYSLMKTSDFVTVWVFRHLKTRKLCFAIDHIRYPLMENQEGSF
ncbi:hypothetical protein CARUB_v10014872mg [Capsella rubella]|uniref:TF-B3 domain-containing protein n=1 Tax=Capsella rubella TaxID=81985 RepID=R0G2K9_9BRAS|nr:hypothetical protein CARUB_v10014872mg [Capsella rubella]